MWRCGSLHALFLPFWTKICLIRLWPCYIIGFCSFNVWSVSIDKDCLEVANTHFDYSAWLFSSRRKPYIHLFFFQMKVFWKLRPIFDKRHAYESQISRVAPSWFFCCFFFSSFIFLFFFSRKNWLLPKTPPLLFFRFSSFFQKGSHDVECFYCCNVTENGRSMLTERLESNDGDQNSEKRVQFVLSTETELLFFSL